MFKVYDSVVLVFAELWNHHCKSVLEYFYHPQKKCPPHQQSLPISLAPGPCRKGPVTEGGREGREGAYTGVASFMSHIAQPQPLLSVLFQFCFPSHLEHSYGFQAHLSFSVLTLCPDNLFQGKECSNHFSPGKPSIAPLAIQLRG